MIQDQSAIRSRARFEVEPSIAGSSQSGAARAFTLPEVARPGHLDKRLLLGPRAALRDVGEHLVEREERRTGRLAPDAVCYQKTSSWR